MLGVSAGAVAMRGCDFHRYQPTPGAAMATPMATSATRRRPLGAGPVRSIRPPLRSRAQARISTKGKPMPRPITVAERTHWGRSSPCITGSMICSTAKETSP